MHSQNQYTVFPFLLRYNHNIFWNGFVTSCQYGYSGSETQNEGLALSRKLIVVQKLFQCAHIILKI